MLEVLFIPLYGYPFSGYPAFISPPPLFLIWKKFGYLFLLIFVSQSIILRESESFSLGGYM